MAIQIIGPSGTTADVDANQKAMRVTSRPIDVGSLGSYAISLTSGTMAAALAANSPIFSFRWSDPTRVCLLRKVTLGGARITVSTTNLPWNFQIVAARSFTASDTGGTPGVLTGNNSKRRTSMGTSLVGDVRISSTAGLTAGTRTLDSQGMGGAVGGDSNVAGNLFLPSTTLWQPDTGGEWPMIFQQNEGFIVTAISVPATGTWSFQVTVEWSEVTTF